MGRLKRPRKPATILRRLDVTLRNARTYLVDLQMAGETAVRIIEARAPLPSRYYATPKINRPGRVDYVYTALRLCVYSYSGGRDMTTTMTTEQIADELRSSDIRIGLLRSEVSVKWGELVGGIRVARSVTVRVSDPAGSGSASRVTVTPDTYRGVEAVRAELARMVMANRRDSASRIASERVRS